jgi:hypothetical protein
MAKKITATPNITVFRHMKKIKPNACHTGYCGVGVRFGKVLVMILNYES